MPADAQSPDGLFCWCRAGFEPELAGELTERAALAGVPGYARTARNSGYVEFFSDEAETLSRALPFAALIFARQKLLRLAELRGIDPKDRIAPILAALDALPRRLFGELWVEHPDSDEGKPLAGLARSFGNALRPALRKAGRRALPNERARPASGLASSESGCSTHRSP
jgi:23S rRNA (cytidine2498-2'-O)-methyltransferase